MIGKIRRVVSDMGGTKIELFVEAEEWCSCGGFVPLIDVEVRKV